MFKDSNNTKGHGSIRKNKVYGAVGVLALGAAAIVGGTSQASADEVTEAPVNSEPVVLLLRELELKKGEKAVVEMK